MAEGEEKEKEVQLDAEDEEKGNVEADKAPPTLKSHKTGLGEEKEKEVQLDADDEEKGNEAADKAAPTLKSHKKGLSMDEAAITAPQKAQKADAEENEFKTEEDDDADGYEDIGEDEVTVRAPEAGGEWLDPKEIDTIEGFYTDELDEYLTCCWRIIQVWGGLLMIAVLIFLIVCVILMRYEIYILR